MGDMGEAFNAMKEHKREIRNKKEPERLAYACERLMGYRYSPGGDCLHIHLPKGTVAFWPYTGWFQGRKPYGKIKGRGINKLMKELESIKYIPKEMR